MVKTNHENTVYSIYDSQTSLEGIRNASPALRSISGPYLQVDTLNVATFISHYFMWFSKFDLKADQLSKLGNGTVHGSA